MRACVSAYVILRFINLFLAIIIICLNAPFYVFFLTLNDHTFHLKFIHIPVTLMACCNANFRLRTIKYYSILFYLILLYLTLSYLM